MFLSVYEACGGTEPMLGRALRLRALDTEVRACAPSDVAAATADRS
ncbi:hypothetical protein AB0D83_00765 [Streptomyces decoyicus]